MIDLKGFSTVSDKNGRRCDKLSFTSAFVGMLSNG